MVSRGELIEIGDGFRLPDLMESTGARIREVGTTNRTTAGRLRGAIGPDTGFVLKVHPSNFRIEGFTAQRSAWPSWPALGVPVRRRHRLRPAGPAPAAARRAGRRRPGCGRAPRWSRRAATSCSAGRRPACCSAAPTWSRRLARHPLARALRVDKLTVAALEATLAGPPAAGRAGAGRRRRRRWPGGPSGSPAGWPRPGIDARRAAERRPRSAAAAPRRCRCPAPRSACPAGLAGAAAGGPRRCAAAQFPAVVGRIEGGRLLLDLRAVPPGRRRAAGRRGTGRRGPARREPACHAGDRDRRARGPRQVHAGARADRDGTRPVGRGDGAGA